MVQDADENQGGLTIKRKEELIWFFKVFEGGRSRVHANTAPDFEGFFILPTYHVETLFI